MKYRVTRQDADEFGLASQERAAKAIAEGRFDGRIIPVEVDVFDAEGERTGERITGRTPLARVTQTVLVGCDPVLMLEARSRPPTRCWTARG